MYHALFTQQLVTLSTLSVLAVKVGLDLEWFLSDLQNEHLHYIINDDQKVGYLTGFSITPTLIINGTHSHTGKSRLFPIDNQYIKSTPLSILDTVDPMNGVIYWANGG